MLTKTRYQGPMIQNFFLLCNELKSPIIHYIYTLLILLKWLKIGYGKDCKPAFFLFFLIAAGVVAQKVRVEQELEAYPTESVDLRCEFIEGGSVTKLTQVGTLKKRKKKSVFEAAIEAQSLIPSDFLKGGRREEWIILGLRFLHLPKNFQRISSKHGILKRYQLSLKKGFFYGGKEQDFFYFL